MKWKENKFYLKECKKWINRERKYLQERMKQQQQQKNVVGRIEPTRSSGRSKQD